MASILSDSHHSDPFSFPVVSELCNIWFQKYHRWFPILHQPSFSHVLGTSGNTTDADYGLALQAIVAITLQHSQLLPTDVTQRRTWQEQLGASIVIECVKTASLQAVQALLILSVLQYGEGRSMQSWNLLAVARR